jgi:hypothetical protein
MNERRQMGRKNFSCYMQVANERTGSMLGHLADISTGGFKLDSANPLQENVDFILRLELSREISTKNFMTFGARSRWCRPDKIHPNSYNIGFQITNIAPGDLEIFQYMSDKYGAQARSDPSGSIRL